MLTRRSLKSSIPNPGGLNGRSNREAFERLKEHEEWKLFFRRSWYDLKIGEKIAEGGQANLFAASGTNLPDGTMRDDLVVKVFKEGYNAIFV